VIITLGEWTACRLTQALHLSSSPLSALQDMPRFQALAGRSKIIHCAEHLPDAAGIMSHTHWRSTVGAFASLLKKGDLAAERECYLAGVGLTSRIAFGRRSSDLYTSQA
jgi:hypothetical protein